jgi:hydrogenase maturation protein HypF
MTGRRIQIRGTVQGVGFRPWVYRLAHEAGIAGRVRNDAHGVTIEAFGGEPAIAHFLRGLETPPPAAEVRDVRCEPIPAEDARGFRIVASQETGDRRVSIPPDLATCPECLAEIVDPADRRYRYAFTNCTHCGPRFTIAREVPYDRATTTMASFHMCALCRAEYEDPLDRRFHAQPNACPECGPRLLLLTAAGQEVAGDPIEGAAALLRGGQVVAVKGLGGYHLACDAMSGAVVQRLRERKRRDEKPFAVLVADLAAAESVAEIGVAEAALLGSVQRPIVLVRRRAGSGIADEVAPGSPLIGLMLAYTPLHHLLVREMARPLVLTSGNLSEEPMAFRDDHAREALGGIADAFLAHDRPVENRCDDSVARVIAGRPVVLRRARGYVPRPVTLSRPLAHAVLACGAHLKNAFCLAAGDQAWLGPHIGDLDTVESCRAFEEAVERLQRFVGITPDVVAHDLHPDYFTTAYALRRPELVKVAVQHHHAHVASAMAEHGLLGPVLGVAYDGTGYGTDGTSWGGEILLADSRGFERLAALRPVRLAGSDRAIREVWRIALALLDDAFDGEPPLDALRLFAGIPAKHRGIVRQMIGSGLHSPLAHGAGRYFDALGAIGLGRPVSRYEGQVALMWNMAADPAERSSYPYALLDGSPMQIDLRPLVRAAVEDLVAGEGAPRVSGRFHNGLAAATADAVRTVALRAGRLPVVLTGGCFQNALLTESLIGRLGGDFDVRLHGHVPPGDGGIALGQAVVADARSRA